MAETLKIVKDLPRKEMVFAIAHIPGGRRVELLRAGDQWGYLLLGERQCRLRHTRCHVRQFGQLHDASKAQSPATVLDHRVRGRSVVRALGGRGVLLGRQLPRCTRHRHDRKLGCDTDADRRTGTLGCTLISQEAERAS